MQGVEVIQGPEKTPHDYKGKYPSFLGFSVSHKVVFSQAFHYLSAGLIISDHAIYVLGLFISTLTNQCHVFEFMKRYHTCDDWGQISHILILAYVDSPSIPYITFFILATCQL